MIAIVAKPQMANDIGNQRFFFGTAFWGGSRFALMVSCKFTDSENAFLFDSIYRTIYLICQFDRTG